MYLTQYRSLVSNKLAQTVDRFELNTEDSRQVSNKASFISKQRSKSRSREHNISVWARTTIYSPTLVASLLAFEICISLTALALWVKGTNQLSVSLTPMDMA